MSGVLDRMAQRALGTLKAVQPLLGPRYAEMRETPRSAAAEPQMTAETETIAPVRGRESDGRKRPVLDRDREAERPEERPRNSSEGPRPVKRLKTPEKVTKAHEPAMPVSAPADQGERKFSAMERATQPGVERSREFEAQHSEAEHSEAERFDEEFRPAPSTKIGETMRIAKAGARAEPIEPRREDAKAEEVREEREGSGIAVVPRPKDEPSRHEMVQSSDSPKRSRLVAAPLLEVDRRGTAQGVRPAAEPVEEKTEIHISIGSIELRAPHVEPRPQAAPFRPRVTLDEFLRRGQERRP